MRNFVPLEQAVALYELTYLRTTNYVPRTKREYLTDLRQLVEYLKTHHVQTVRAVKRSHLQGFLAQLDQLQLRVPTRRRKVSALRSFFLFLYETGERPGDPADELVPPEVEERRLRYLTVGTPALPDSWGVRATPVHRAT
jgi:site-specific recombinase XerD